MHDTPAPTRVLCSRRGQMLREYTTSTRIPTVPHEPSVALEVRGMRVSYGAQPVLDDVSFTLSRGQLVGIIGPNGAGKTTMLKAILGLIPAEAGAVAAGGQPIARRGGHVAYVPQRDAINWRFPASVADVVLMGRYGRLGWLKRDRATLPGVGWRGCVCRPADRGAVGRA